ncbi:T9SS type A sorting domain-containing protein [Edaphocola flava]|uniref:T9SS type A sorting domain-containing protein n=1 Tax=Edaphocola flava TaxID=2499629 RepID=UPI00100BF673|nr:T9SS type A sorting domain-containing protein [Edaphocola flava]
MFKYYKFLLFILISASPYLAKAQTDTLAFWTFESRSGQQLISPPNVYGPITPEQGNGNLTSLHQNGAYAATYANAGNGTGKSLNLNRWTTVGDYIQFQVSTVGKSSIQIGFEQGSASGNGPLDFKVSYSTDGINFTDLPAGSFQQTASVNGDWTAATYLPGFHKTFTLPAALNNVATAYIRISTTSLNSVSPGTQVAPAGNSRFDNILITGTTIAPTTQITNVATSDSTFCNAGANTFQVSFNTNAATTTTYTVERSNASGSFANPVVIGSGTASPINATIPAGTTAGGNYQIRVVSAGSVSLNAAGPIVIDPAITVSLQPAGFTVCEGAIVNLEMLSPNAQSYQWLHNGSPVANNSFSNSFTLSAATLSEAGSYRVALTHGACADTSNSAVIVVNPGTIPTNTTASGSRFFGAGSNFPVIANNGSCGRLATIKSLSNILGNTTVSLTAGAPQQAGTNGPWHVGRSFTLNAATAPTGNVALSFYFSPADWVAYNVAAPAAQQIAVNPSAQTLGNLYFSKLTSLSGLGSSSAVLTPDSVSFQNGYWKVSITVNSFNSLSTFYAHGSNFQACPTPTISITESANNICSGSSVSYMATISNQGANPVYQWQVNGTNMATGATYSYTPADGDTVTCILTNSDCFNPTADTSNAIIMHVTPTVTPAVVIASNNPTSCAGMQVTFTATPTNGGTAPVYQWKVNGNNTGSGGVTFDYTPNDGDIITCELTSNAPCLSTTSPVLSNAITADVEALITAAISVTASPASNAPQGSPVVYTAAVSGTSVYSLDWYVNNQLLLQQQSPNNTYTRTATAVPDTVYAVLHVEGCFTAPTYQSNQVIVTSTNSIPKVAMDLGLTFYPNPVQNSLTIEVHKGDVKEVQLMNMLGQVLQNEKTASSKKQVVNFAHLASGVYYIKVRVQYAGEDYVIVEKVIKE